MFINLYIAKPTYRFILIYTCGLTAVIKRICYVMLCYFFTQSSSSFRSTCPYHRSLFCCHTNAMSSISNLSLSFLLGNLSFSLTPHIHLSILISARWSVTLFFFLTGQVSFPCNILLRKQLLYNLPLIINDTSLLVSNGTNCLNLFQLIRILTSTAASASPSTLSMSPR